MATFLVVGILNHAGVCCYWCLVFLAITMPMVLSGGDAKMTMLEVLVVVAVWGRKFGRGNINTISIVTSLSFVFTF